MKKKSPLNYVRPNIRALRPYSTARDEGGAPDIDIWLDANESPFPNGVNRYPDPHQRVLKERVAAIKGVDSSSLFLGGAGSDEAIDLIYRIFCTPGRDNVVSVRPTYGVYSVAAGVNDVEYRTVPLGRDYAFPLRDVLAATDKHTKVIWVCSPNNPTGRVVPVDQICELCMRFDGIVAVDEAYIDFCPANSMLPLLSEYPNLIVLQTFSKAWGMAGLRVGMAFAAPEVISLMDAVKYPYNISGLVQKELLRRLEHPRRNNLDDSFDSIVEQRKFLSIMLSIFPFTERVYPSDANFILVKVKNPDDLYCYLAERGILVRNRNREPGCEGCLRITVGTILENAELLDVLRNYRDELPPEAFPRSHRRATRSRSTAETDVTVTVDLDREPSMSHVDTGLKFFDHMLDQLHHHGGFHLNIFTRGDLEVDEHHSMEDTAIVLGEAIAAAIGDKSGIERYGFTLPMDESKAGVLIDFSGRPELQWDVKLSRERVGDTPTEMYRHFFRTLAVSMKATVHIWAFGENDHHILEAIFKAFGRSLRRAVYCNGIDCTLPSSKGDL